MKLSTDTKIILGISLVTVLILSIGVFLLSKGSSTTTLSQKVDEALLIKADSHRIGSDSARVKVIEFGDYQCPACGAANPIVNKILIDYKDKIEFVFRNFAFIGNESKWAGEAAECSAEQGKFWEYHNYLYDHQKGENQGTFSKDHLKEFAKFLNLDTQKFNSCLDSDKTSATVSRDTADGQAAGVNSTPTFFINGVKNAGVLKESEFKNLIDTELKKL